MAKMPTALLLRPCRWLAMQVRPQVAASPTLKLKILPEDGIPAGN
jgi:hypothetical protein